MSRWAACSKRAINGKRQKICIKKRCEIQPDYALAANNLAYLMLEHGGNVNVALSLAQLGRKGMPDSPNSADTLGWAYYQQGVYNAAIDLFQEAIKAQESVKGSPENPTYHYHLGMAYLKSNNFDMAKKQLQYTLQISPNYSQAGRNQENPRAIVSPESSVAHGTSSQSRARLVASVPRVLARWRTRSLLKSRPTRKDFSANSALPHSPAEVKCARNHGPQD